MSAKIRHIGNNGSFRTEKTGEPFSDADLPAFNQDNKEAFKKAYDTYYPAVYFFARRFVSAEDAIDLTAEAFYRLWKQDKKFKRPQSIKSFLQVTVRNAAINQLRSDKYKSSQAEQILYLQGSIEDDSSLSDITAELLALVYEQIEKLPLQAKRVFKLSYLENLRDDQIAERLQIKRRTVRNHKTAALRSLRIACMLKASLLSLVILIWAFSETSALSKSRLAMHTIQSFF
jgi:RNA polymerase sigma-70 factor (ECF subfamily)